MVLFPAFLKLADRRCLVVGGGRVAEEKTQGLLRAEAQVRVIAPEATRRIQAWAREGKIRWDARAFRAADLNGMFLVVAATSSPTLHGQIYAQAKPRGVLCNVVDDPEHCDLDRRSQPRARAASEEAPRKAIWRGIQGVARRTRRNTQATICQTRLACTPQDAFAPAR
jgi:hypothetical protein